MTNSERIFVLTWLVSFWWWELRYQEIAEAWSFGLYLFIILYAVALFFMAVLLVPGEMEGVNDAYDYFMSIRHWFLGIVLFTRAVSDPLDTVLKGTDWLLQSGVLVLSGVIVMTCVAGMASRRRAVQLGAAGLAFGYQLLHMFRELGVLGS